MKVVSLLNISEFNNQWNKSVLEMVRQERERMYRGPSLGEQHHDTRDVPLRQLGSDRIHPHGHALLE